MSQNRKSGADNPSVERSGISSDHPAKDQASVLADYIASENDFNSDVEDNRGDQVYSVNYDEVDATIINCDWVGAATKFLNKGCLHHTAMMSLACSRSSPPEPREFLTKVSHE